MAVIPVHLGKLKVAIFISYSFLFLFFIYGFCNLVFKLTITLHSVLILLNAATLEALLILHHLVD